MNEQPEYTHAQVQTLINFHKQHRPRPILSVHDPRQWDEYTAEERSEIAVQKIRDALLEIEVLYDEGDEWEMEHTLVSMHLRDALAALTGEHWLSSWSHQKVWTVTQEQTA